MSKESELLALAERCKRATMPTRELDARIHAAMAGFIGPEWRCEFKEYDASYIAWKGDSHALCYCEPYYTRDIDAALSLAPRDPALDSKPMLWSIAYDEDGVGGERSYIAGFGKGYHDPEYIYGHSDVMPALAVCCAALRARAAEAK